MAPQLSKALKTAIRADRLTPRKPKPFRVAGRNGSRVGWSARRSWCGTSPRSKPALATRLIRESWCSGSAAESGRPETARDNREGPGSQAHKGIGSSLAKRSAYAAMWLRMARRANGFSRKRLAKLLKVDESTVFRWEAGRKYPAPHLAAGLRAILAAGDQ
jgi:DNA-binding transcriptional regulator YiaG